MCVILYKPKGTEVPGEDVLRRCFTANPHGAGFMIARGGAVQIRKGFMEYGHFKAALEKANIKKEEVAVLHFRIATAGGVKPENCHPFPLTDETAPLRQTRIDAEVGIAHNGVIPIKARDGMSDTMTFIRDLFSRRAIFSNRTEPGVKFLIDEFVGNSKIIVLHADGKVEFFGIPEEEWIRGHGCLFSNRSFAEKKEHKPTYIAAENRFPGLFTERTDPHKMPSDEEQKSWALANSTKKAQFANGFVNADRICPNCQRAALSEKDADGVQECAWCSLKVERD